MERIMHRCPRGPRPRDSKTLAGQRLRKPRFFRPWLEILEDRRVLTNLAAGQQAALAPDDASPYRFEANQGQTDAQVRFLSRGDGYALFLTDTAVVLTLQSATAPANTGAAPP